MIHYAIIGIITSKHQNKCHFITSSNINWIVIGPFDAACQEFFNHPDLKTWISDWQIEKKRVSPIHSRAIKSKAENLLQQVIEIEKDISFVLPQYYSYLTNDEWLCTFLFPTKTRLNEIIQKIK